MYYIHQTVCISPQETFGSFDRTQLREPVDNRLEVIEPSYEGIPRNLLRRMGKAVRIGVGACAPLLRTGEGPVDGIIIGTGNGGTEDSFRFLQQMVEYDEGLLTPGNFVQSTSNAVSSQLSLMGNNKGYNLTHVHRGLAFEYAMLDAALLLAEDETASYLLAGVDELSPSNFILDELAGWYSSGVIAGEGAAAFYVSRNRNNAIARVEAVRTFHSEDVEDVRRAVAEFLDEQGEQPIDVLLSGNNGDARMQKYYSACEEIVGDHIPVTRFKHFSGEYPTASAFALWMACQLLTGPVQRILIYNNFKGLQHSLILVSAVLR